MSKFKRKSKMLMKSALVVAAASLMATPSFAAGPTDITEWVAILSGNILSLKELGIMFGYLVGTVLWLVGLFNLYKDSKQPNQGHAKNGLIAIGVGTGFLIITILIQVFAGSMGGDSSAVDKVKADSAF